MYLLGALMITVISLGGAYEAVKEGAVCLLIVSPLLLTGVFAGTAVGRALFQRRDKLQVTVIPLLVLLTFLEGASNLERRAVVSDTIVINAPAAEVWKHVVAFPRIEAEPEHWLNKVGLPSASETTCEGKFVGLKRACIFSNGLVFNEVVTELEPARLLTFDIVEQPQDPELLGHRTLKRGQFELQGNVDGTTTLIGRS